jgi:photosystem II stability/assembly factor-like uncharacterized protein
MYCMSFRDEQNGWAAGQGIIVHTADGGKTWEKQYVGPAHILCIYFKNAKDGFAAGESDLYMFTHDGGATWKEEHSRFSGQKFRKIFFTDDKTGFLLSEGGVFKTTDGGTTWKDMGPKRPEEFYNSLFTGLTARDAKHLVLVGEKEFLYTSDDAGNTWVANKKDFFTGDRRNFYGVAFKDANTGWISCSTGSGTDVDALCTTDGGATWTPKMMFNGYQLKTLEFHGNCGWATSRMNDKMVYVTYDGGATWNEQNVTNENKVNAAYIFSQKVGYVGVNGEDYHFRLYVPKK